MALPRSLMDQAGLTLVESVMAVGILALGLTALLSTFPLASSKIQSGRQFSTAVFLAVERLEAIKAFVASADPAQGFANATAANFPDEPYATIAGSAQYRRQVTILDSPAVPVATKVVQVTVFYQPISQGGLAAPETSVSLSTLIASR